MAFYAPWIKCIKENAEKNQLSKVEINRICFDLVTDLKFVPFDLE